MPRIKCPGQEMAYHCTSRLVDGVQWWDEVEKEYLQDLMWRVTTFCGLELLGYTTMDNHYHQLLLVPAKQEASNAELLRRYEVLNGRGRGRWKSIQEGFEAGGGQAAYWRGWLLRQMGDISEHQKIFKERFSKWFNRRHERRGTLWCGRFNGTVVEVEGESLERVAAYIALNPVRAGMVRSPEDYRFSSYHAALGGDQRCLAGIRRVTGMEEGVNALSRLRLVMAWEGMKESGDGDKRSLDAQVCREIVSSGGQLPLSATLYWRNRYLVEGVVIGTHGYVEEMARRLGRRARRRTGSCGEQMKGSPGGLCALGRLRRAVYGFE